MTTFYDMQAVDNLAQRYNNAGGEVILIKEGSLLDYGLAVFTGPGLKSAIVKEKYLNEWSSAYTVKIYNKMPKKYQTFVDNI